MEKYEKFKTLLGIHDGCPRLATAGICGHCGWIARDRMRFEMRWSEVARAIFMAVLFSLYVFFALLFIAILAGKVHPDPIVAPSPKPSVTITSDGCNTATCHGHTCTVTALYCETKP